MWQVFLQEILCQTLKVGSSGPLFKHSLALRAVFLVYKSSGFPKLGGEMFVLKINRQRNRDDSVEAKWSLLTSLRSVYYDLFVQQWSCKKRYVDYVGVWPRMLEWTSAIWNEHCMNSFFCNKTGDWNYNSCGVDPVFKLAYQIECHVIVAWDIHHRIAKRWYV